MAGTIEIFDEIGGIFRCLGVGINTHVELGPEFLTELPHFMDTEGGRLCLSAMTAEEASGGALRHRADEVLPLKIRDGTAAGVADQAGSELVQSVDDIGAEAISAGVCTCGVVEATIDTASGEFNELAIETRVGVAQLLIGKDNYIGVCLFHTIPILPLF